MTEFVENVSSVFSKIYTIVKQAKENKKEVAPFFIFAQRKNVSAPIPDFFSEKSMFLHRR